MNVCNLNGRNVISVFQPSVCAAGRSCSAGVESSRAASQVTTVPRAQTHSGLQERTRTHRQVCAWTQKSMHLYMFTSSLFRANVIFLIKTHHIIATHLTVTLESRSLFLFSSPISQCAHLHLHDRREPATHSAHHVPAHRRVHRACAGQTQAFNGGWGGDPEPHNGGKHGGRSRREDTGHQITQNWCVCFVCERVCRSACVPGLFGVTVFVFVLVLKWLMTSAGRSFSSAVPEQLRLLPLLFRVSPSFVCNLVHCLQVLCF